MEVNEQIERRTVDLTYPSLNFTLSINLPVIIFKLLDATFPHCKTTKDAQDIGDWRLIEVAYEDKKYVVKGPNYISHPHKDLVNTLNELFICVAFTIAHNFNHMRLMHCAAYANSKEAVLLFGKRKSGKSTLVTKKALADYKVYGDDICLWSTKGERIISLGFPIRRRRPVFYEENNQSYNDCFIAGHSLAYSRKNCFRLASPGESIEPTEVYELTRGFQEATVAPSNIARYFEEFWISIPPKR